MAKKGWLKAVVGVGAVAVAGKVAYDKLKAVREEYSKEESESVDAEVKKYNAVMDKKIVEVEDEEFTGCEVKTVLSNTVIDLGLAAFEKDVYINLTSKFSNLTIILPEGVNVAMDVDDTISRVNSRVENTDEEGISTVYVIGKAFMSCVEVLPVNFYVDDDGDFEDVIEPDMNDDADDAAQADEAVKADDTVQSGKAVQADDTVKAEMEAQKASDKVVPETADETKAPDKTETADKNTEETDEVSDSTVEVKLEEI